jgi:RNA polymerase sigma-70 factor (ECF subfamily)
MDATEAAAVLARARQGDSEAFRALVERHSRSVFRLAFRMTGNEQDAEDVVQESLLRAYRQLGRFEARANFGTWLYRITANCAVDLMRARQARHDVARGESLDEVVDLRSNHPGPERLTASAEIEQRVADAMSALTPLERAAFTLRHYEGRTIDEISQTLGLKTSAAKHSVFRAVKKLRAALEPLRSAQS